jgi:putative hydrolase of the HAD superfamily
MNAFGHIDAWVFDMDNTLYDAETHVFVEISARMSKFVARYLGIPETEANAVRKNFYQKYGTTLRGLMTEHGMKPEPFLAEVHDIDLSSVPRCEIVREYLSRLPGRKFVFTNSSRAFAAKMTAHLGIAHHFEGIFAIEDAEYAPKPLPATYRAFLEKHKVAPKTACMFEDMEINLRPAHDFGMTTVWLHGKNEAASHPHVHHKAPALSDWLREHLIKEKQKA